MSTAASSFYQRWRVRMTVLGVMVLAAVTPACGADKPAVYGTRVDYKKGKPVEYPDFVLTYAGQREVQGPIYPRPFIYQDFDAVSKGKTTRVSWSSGTGAIGPQWFSVDRRPYQLELSYADKVGKLKNGEMVVSRR